MDTPPLGRGMASTERAPLPVYVCPVCEHSWACHLSDGKPAPCWMPNGCDADGQTTYCDCTEPIPPMPGLDPCDASTDQHPHTGDRRGDDGGWYCGEHVAMGGRS